MTVIVGLVEEDGMYIGSDTLCVSDYTKSYLSIPKIATIKETFLVGVAGMLREQQVATFYLDPPVPSPDEDLDRYMIKRFIPHLSTILESFDLLSKKDGLLCWNSCMLVLVRGRIYEIGYNLSLERIEEKYNAVGSGTETALGALFGINKIRDLYISPENRIKTAVEACERYCKGCGGHSDILQLSYKENNQNEL